jgi:hypothetical protein
MTMLGTVWLKSLDRVVSAIAEKTNHFRTQQVKK